MGGGRSHEDFGNVKVKLDKPHYVVGETVSGMILLDLKMDAPVDKLYVKAKGKEKVKWEEHWKTPIYETTDDGTRRVVGHDYHEKEYEAKNQVCLRRRPLSPALKLQRAAVQRFPARVCSAASASLGARRPAAAASLGQHDERSWRWAYAACVFLLAVVLQEEDPSAD